VSQAGYGPASGASVLFKLQPFADVLLIRLVYFSLVYSHWNCCILNWPTASWSSIAGLVKLNKDVSAVCLKVNCR